MLLNASNDKTIYFENTQMPLHISLGTLYMNQLHYPLTHPFMSWLIILQLVKFSPVLFLKMLQPIKE